MHELGVVFYVIDDVKKIAEENSVQKVTGVTLEIGEVSTVIPEYLEDCWQWAVKREPLMTEAKLKIERIDAVTICEDCGKTYPTVKYGKTCPFCKSGKTVLLSGNQFTIKEIEVV